MEINQKIGLFGGTFDPVHKGHINMMVSAYREFELDKLIIIPTGHPYQKERKGRLITAAEHRIKMLEAAVAELDLNLEISTIESSSTKPNYTVNTIDFFQKEYPGAKLYWICGSDILFGIDTWKNPAKLLQKIAFIVIVRGNDTLSEAEAKKRFLEEKYGAEIYFSQYHGEDISSTMIRNATDQDLSQVPESVKQYILDHKLYDQE